MWWWTNIYIGHKKATITTANTKSEHSDKVVTRMISHALNDPEGGESLAIALFYGSLPGFFSL